MGKIFQHIFSQDSEFSGTVAHSAELSSLICTHLEKTVCNLNCKSSGEALYVTPLTSDALVIGKCICYENKGDAAFFHNYIISNTDYAKLINEDPYFFTRIVFSEPFQKQLNAESLNSIPMKGSSLSAPQNISGIMLQNAYCSFMDIIANNSMKYLSTKDSFSPTEIIGLVYSVLPIHAALNLSFVTCTDNVPEIGYNLCFAGQKLFKEVPEEHKSGVSTLFSSEQSLSISEYPRMSSLLEQCSVSLEEISAFHRFSFDFINIVNKHSGNQLDPLSADIYEAILCLQIYANDKSYLTKRILPNDISAALEWLDDTIKILPSMEQDIRMLIPKQETSPKSEAAQEHKGDSISTKRAEREMATKIIALISTNPSDFRSFVSIKYQVMREARMETISLSLFQDILKASLHTMLESEIDDSKVTMTAMAISLAFETVDYRIFGSECISYAPYDYDAMLDFIIDLPSDSRLIYNEVVSLHRKTNMLSIALSSHKKPSRRKKSSKKSDETAETEDYKDIEPVSEEEISSAAEAISEQAEQDSEQQLSDKETDSDNQQTDSADEPENEADFAEDYEDISSEEQEDSAEDEAFEEIDEAEPSENAGDTPDYEIPIELNFDIPEAYKADEPSEQPSDEQPDADAEGSSSGFEEFILDAEGIDQLERDIEEHSNQDEEQPQKQEKPNRPNKKRRSGRNRRNK